MEISEILRRCDHTLLSRTATPAEIEAAVREGARYKVASVCIPPCFVREARKIAEVPICTVIGFPNGYSTKSIKLSETREALDSGADEIDFVINVNLLKAKKYDQILSEIETLKRACGEKILKVIIETCLLTNEEKLKMCELVYEGGADFLKTSTGFSTSGATKEDVALLRSNLHPSVKIKAAGGIRTLKDAEEFITIGADRIGTSSIIKAIKESI